MPPRFTPRCRFCPQPASAPVLKPTPTVQDVTLAITSPGEGERLWKHVLFGTSTCVSMIEGYAALSMPGNPRAALVALRDRIEEVLSKYEESHGLHQDHDRSSEEPMASDDKTQGETPPGGV